MTEDDILTEDIYNDDYRDEIVGDSISPEEEAFMKGYDEAYQED